MTVDITPEGEPFSASAGPMGVLVLHGFTGNPSSLRDLAHRLASADYSVELPRLPGHGTTLENMMTTTWADWSGAALAAYDDLAGRCERVAVVGLSMGGSLSVHVAANRPDVAGLVLINPLVKPPASDMLDGLSELIGAGVETIDAIGSDIKKEGVTEASYPGTPLRSAHSLFAALVAVQAGLATIHAPTLLLSSREDHVVTTDNGDEVVASLGGPVERIWLENSYHVATLDNDRDLVETATLNFLATILAS